jgi:1-aminocyclopropane-1-carboxylate deaminase
MMLLQELHDEAYKTKELRVSVLRLDLIHPLAGGNKIFKLRYNLERAAASGADTIITCGGAFSNHILATAWTCHSTGFKSIGLIRGEEPAVLSDTLLKARELGMQLDFVSRALYRDKPALESYIRERYNEFAYYFIPEGGSNEEGIRGCEDIVSTIPVPFDQICLACGTGTTLAGVIRSLKPDQTAIGIQVLKGENYIRTEVQKMLPQDRNNWKVYDQFHFGGYAKSTPELDQYCLQFYEKHMIPVEPVYTGKLFYAVEQLAGQNSFRAGSHLVIVHSGGLQGRQRSSTLYC